jgi:hypothetical protein
MRRFVLLFPLLVLTACSTIGYRQLQGDFERAVAADNQRSVSPFTDAAPDEYASVWEELSEGYIGGLDARLRPNAWMLRGISAWRLGEFADAERASRKGLELDPKSGSRDQVVLTALPGLIYDAEAINRWRESSKSQATYDTLRLDMSNAWVTLKDAAASFGDLTPKSTRAFVHYHQWRVAFNWAQMIIEVEDASGADRNAMRTWAKETGGVGAEPTDAAEAAKGGTVGHPFHDLIQAQER